MLYHKLMERFTVLATAVLSVHLHCMWSVQGLPDGPPNHACDNLLPSSLHGMNPRNTESPYKLTVYGLENGTYRSEGRYTVTLVATNGTNFKGFLIVTRKLNNKGSGRFIPLDGQQTTCEDENGITQEEALSKMNLTFRWVAPEEGTGTIQFRFAVVQSLKVFWADQQGPIIQEFGFVSVEPTSVDSTSMKPTSVDSTSVITPSSTPKNVPGTNEASLKTGWKCLVLVIAFLGSCALA